MQKVLDQSAIDALFAPPITETMALESERYNFGGAGQITNEQMRAISLVNDNFARSAMHTLGAWLRTQTQVTLVAGEQMPYAEFVSRIPEPGCVCLLRLQPLDGMGLLEVDVRLALTMIDLLLGGRGGVESARELTDIEDAILVSIVEMIVRELSAAWDTVGLRFRHEADDKEDNVARLMSGTERTLCVSFEMELLGVRGQLNFCLPAVVLNAVHRKLATMSAQTRPKADAALQRAAELLQGARMRAALRMPLMRIGSTELSGLTEGALLELPLPRQAMAELVLGGSRLCEAMPVGRGGLRGAMVNGQKALMEPAAALEAEAVA